MQQQEGCSMIYTLGRELTLSGQGEIGTVGDKYLRCEGLLAANSQNSQLGPRIRSHKETCRALWGQRPGSHFLDLLPLLV